MALTRLPTRALKGKTSEQWLKEMKTIPCYRPAPPFFDYCLNMGQVVKRYNCGKCLDKHGLKDYIE